MLNSLPAWFGVLSDPCLEGDTALHRERRVTDAFVPMMGTRVSSWTPGNTCRVRYPGAEEGQALCMVGVGLPLEGLIGNVFSNCPEFYS